MRERRLPLFVLLASALTFLASLFLPWRQWHGLVRLPFVFYNGGFDGWIGVVGDVAVLLAVATVFACLAALVRPKLAASLPLGGLGVGLGYFAAAVAVQIHAYSVFTEIGLRNDPRRPAGFASHSHSFWAYGFYLGVAGGAVAGLCGLFLRRRQLLVRRPPADVVADAIGIGLLVSFLLPWVREDSALGVTFPGVGDSATAIGALVLLLGAGRLLSSARKGLRLALAVAVAILIGASASATPMFVSRAYGAWIAIGLAVALVAIEAARARSVRPAALPSGRTALRAAAALVLLIALFLPWERLSGAPQGFAASANGWSVFPGGVAGALALLLLLAAALLPELEAHALTIALAIAFLVSVIGTYLAVGADSRVFGLAGGSYVGFAATAALLLSVLGPFRPIRVDPHRALARAVPLAASLACLGAVMLPLWEVLPRDWTQADAVSGELWVAALLLALFLIRAWILSAARLSTGHTLTLVPLALIVLPALQLIFLRTEAIRWGGVILISLSVVLALLGWIEEHDGLESAGFPELLRIDRLPETES
jgi:hypothetical protein